MKMIFIVLAFTLAPMARGAGHETGNGGGGFLCPTVDGQEVIMADVWEAKAIWSLMVPDVPMDRQYWIYEAALQRLHRLAGDDFATAVKMIVSLQERVINNPSGEIEAPTDANLYGVPDSCRFVGVFLYFDRTGELVVDRAYYALLKNGTNVAAGKLHEGVYWYLRSRYGHTNSRMARKIVGCLLAIEDCPPFDWRREL
jgi:hypothetical protein